MSAASDDDDFGDFQEAQIDGARTETEEISQSSNVNTKTLKDISPQQSIELDLLSDLLEDPNLWNIDHFVQTTNSDSVDNNLLDLFSYFDADFKDLLISDNAKQSIELWQLLRVVEETNALKFRWLSSRLYSRFIKALNSYESYQSSAGNPTTKASFLINSEFTVDSIDESEGNEMNLPSCSNESNTLDCDFFQSDTSQISAPSLLEQELNSLGLSELTKIQTIKPQKSNSQSTLNGTNHKPDNLPRYLSVAELNEEAQSFYERMPNLSFMLIDRVIRDR